MTIDQITSQALTRWMDGSGPMSEIALSSRVRLARNLAGVPFPHAMNDSQGKMVIDQAKEAIKELNRFGFLGKMEFYLLNGVPPLDRRVLVEKHLISPQHSEGEKPKALALAPDESVSIMVNEEDHLRVQCLFSGLQPEAALKLALRVDNALESKMDFAYTDRLGYLTCCPTNTGTGLRASVMVHLPGLGISNQLGRVFQTAAQLGLTVRGFYGEGTEAVGNIFQISNQITLGRSEEEIVANLQAVASKIIEQERLARENLKRDPSHSLEDRIWRSFGILSHARVISSDEAMKLLSDVRLGLALGIINTVDQKTLNQLLVSIRPAFLQKQAGGELTPYERDQRRAAMIRSKITGR